MRKIALLAILTFIGQIAFGQSRWLIGPEVGFTVSKVGRNDTFVNNFTGRNKFAPRIGAAVSYNLGSFAAIDAGLHFAMKGYKVNNDTLAQNPSVTRNISTLEIPLGLSFRQTISGGSFITEKFGLIGTYSLGKDSITTGNTSSNPSFRIGEKITNTFYPMFYLGVKIGGGTASNNRYEFGATYMQSLAESSILNVQYGSNLSKKFPLNYRGGYLAISFTYFFNTANFKTEKSDYFID